MKRRVNRALAVILAVAIALSGIDISDSTAAATIGDVVDSADVSGNTPGTGTDTGTNTGTNTDAGTGTGTETPGTGTGTETPGTGTETPGTGADTGTETPGTGADTGTETPGTGADTGTETPGTGTNTETPGTEEPDTSTEEPTEESTEEPTEENTEEPTEESTEEPTEESTEEPTEEDTEEPTEEETETEETEVLEEETELLEETGIMLMSAEDSVNIPQSVDNLVRGTVYYVRTYDDVLALQELSYQDSLEGCIFEFAKLNSSTNAWNLTDIGFTGLGNADHPFRGTIREYFASGVTFEMSRPMFNYLGTGASITNFTFTLSDATSGLADYYVVTDTQGVTITNVAISGTIYNPNGAAGALYGTVINDTGSPYEIAVTDAELNVTGVTRVSGQIAGGYLGDVQSNITVRVTSGANVAAAVNSTATAAGGIVGKLGKDSCLYIDGEISIGNTVTGTGSAGGIVGLCEDAVIVSDQKVTKTGGQVQGTVNAGGFAGLVIRSETEISNFLMQAAVAATQAGTSYAGGVVGSYQSDSADAYLTISNVGIQASIGAGANNTASRTSGAGGVIGSIIGDHVTITDLDCADADGYAFLPQMQYNSSQSCTGGVAGIVQGKNIELSNISVKFYEANHAIGGYKVGDILGSIETQSKLRLTDITVAGNYTAGTDPAYLGGIAGSVEAGSILALCGTIDVSSLSYLNNRNGGLYGTNQAASGVYKGSVGYIAGRQTESVIYLEQGAVLKKNAQASDSGNAVWTDNDSYNNVWSGYTLDEIGTYGGVYKNIADAANGGLPVIDYSMEYGQEVTGSVTYADGTYRLNSDADALRLALALNTFDASSHALRFAGNCFPGATADTLLAADYLVTDDLDFSGTGIFSLCRNDSTDYAFTGSMTGDKGNGDAPSISLCIVSKQAYGGMFPKVKDAAFSNLKLTGTLYYTMHSGGIAPYAEGSVTLERIETNMKLRTCSYIPNANTVYACGGLFGQYDPGSGTFSCTNSTIAPEIENIRVQQIAGGIVGYLKTGTTSVAKNVTVENVEIGSKLTAHSRFSHNYGTYSHARVGGMFAYIGYDMTANQSQSWETALGGTCTNATYAVLNLSGITVKDARIDLSAVTDYKANVRVTGGLFGYDWNNVEVTADQITVKDSAVNSLGHTGGLLAALGGKIDFGEVTLDGLAMTDKRGNEKFSGLLIGDGRNAVVTLDDSKYTVTNTTVSGYSDFDEIVGVNCKIDGDRVNNYSAGLQSTNGLPAYSDGGIVNIIKSEFTPMTGGYASYQNRVVSQGNRYTRYYYNLFTPAYETEKITVSGTTAEIDSPEKLMLWHLAKYMRSGIQRFITPYFEGGSHTAVTTWNLSGTLDMNGYSYYPTVVSNGTYEAAAGTVIKLYGEELDAKENGNKQPSDSAKQHYMMHAGLFYRPSGALTVSGITFQGTAAKLEDSRSGVLAVGNLSGTVTVKDMTLDGVRLAGYAGEQGAYGLLISNVIDGTSLTVDGVTTTGYGADAQAAAALIGTVGSNTATYVQTRFLNMQVADGKGEVFSYASFIYHYDSVDNADTNRCFGLYTFEKEDCTKGNVTYGQELSYGVDYMTTDRDADLEAEIENAKKDIYNPYVYEIKDIYVNPRNGSITEGCGTYEDPYIIENRLQFLTLYCYLTGSSAYDNVFEIVDGNGRKWSVNPIGGGSADGRCNLASDSDSHTAVEYGEDGFPTRDEMRTAYYMITEDIDLSDYANLTEYVMNSDFSGLGTTQYPFAGVLAGKEKADGTYPVITLPGTREPEASGTIRQERYGLIQYMKGAVVKDLTIQNDTADGKVYVRTAGGGVAAVVLGGDNIIDNVTVKIELNASGASTMSGGYVGEVKKGSVIIRNMDAASVESYSVKVLYAGAFMYLTTVENTEPNHAKYKKNCRVIGWVEDGCVIYEGGNVNDTSKVLEKEDFGIADGIPLSYSFPIVNGNYLEKNSSGTAGSRITVTDSASGYTITLQNDAQMEIAALALNADAFSIYDSGNRDTNHYNGYDHTAVCRKAAYDDLDCGVSRRDASSDFALAVGSDDNNGHYPYFYYKYMNFDGVAGGYEATQKESGDKRLSMLNWSNGSAEYGSIAVDKTVTYELAAGVTYDLTGYGWSFRGFGCLYPARRVNADNNNVSADSGTNYSLFKANFNGNGATVTVAMDRGWDSSVNTTGMFNYLIASNPDGFTIEKLNIRDSTFTGSSASPSGTGAIAGYVRGVWNFEEITYDNTGLKDANTGEIYGVAGNSYAGGLVGAIDYQYASTSSTYTPTQKITFGKCSTKCVKVTGNTGVGGLVGYVTGRTNNYYSWYGDIFFENCGVSGGTVSSANANIGGFIGRVGHANGWYYGNNYVNSNGQITNANSYKTSIGTVTITQTDSTICAVDDMLLQSDINSGVAATNSAGGLIGEFITYWNNGEDNLTIRGVRINGLTIVDKYRNTDFYGIGGLCGGTWSCKTTVEDVQITGAALGSASGDTTAERHHLPAGGLFGSISGYRTAIDDISVTGSSVASYDMSAGGLIGVCNSNYLTVGETGKIVVSGSTIESASFAAGGLIGNVSHGNTNSSKWNWDISNVDIAQSGISNGAVSSTAGNNAAGGVLGRVSNVAAVSLENIRVGSDASGKQTQIEGANAGGLAGYVAGNTAVNLSGTVCVGCSADASGTVQADPGDTTVYAYGKADANAGGLFGYNGIAINYNEKSSADVQIQKTRIGAYTTGNYAAAAGGITGQRHLYGNNNENTCIYDSAAVRNCVIAAYNANHSTGSGGLFGRVTGGNNNTSRICVYKPKLENNSIGVADTIVSMEELEKISPTDASVSLYDKANNQDMVHWKAADLTEDTVGNYSLRIGNYVGVWEGETHQLYILRPELNYDADFNGGRPAIDIGNNKTNVAQNNVAAYGYGYPYEWRQYCHIVYFEPDTSDTKTDQAADVLDAALIQNGEDYLYHSIGSIVSAYRDADASGEAYLEDYNLNIALSGGSSILDYYDKCATGDGTQLNGVSVVRADGGSAQDIMDSIIAILTNVGGIGSNPSDAKMTGLLNVSAVKAKITADGKIVADTRTAQSITVSNNRISYTELTYDEPTDDGGYTVTLLYFRYGWKGADGNDKYETIYVPVFVVERIALFGGLSIMEGEQYSLDKAKDTSVSYTDDVTVAHDSSYTLFAELAYGEARNKAAYADYTVAKTLTFEKTTGTDAAGDYIWGPVAVPKGLRMTLVDTETGKAYYYTQEKEGDTDIDFTEFKDAEGNAYSYREISSIKTTDNAYSYTDRDGNTTDLSGHNMGLERFYIYVDPSGVESIENTIFRIALSTDKTDAGTMNFLDRTESDGIQITWMPGLDISFEGEGTEGATYVTGAISQENQIGIDTRIQISADQTYWDEKGQQISNFIDSENNQKYLDVAIYLIDTTTGEYVNLPEGTNILMNGGDPHPVSNQYVTYAYKDWNRVFPIGSIMEDITGEQTIVTETGESVDNYCHITLDFSLANVDDYVDKTYKIYLELRRTSDPNYPLGDRSLDTYEETVLGMGNKEMAVALEVSDLMDLGINTYQETTHSYEIPFTTKLDFTDMIAGDNPYDITACADNDYLVTYRLKKKVETTGGGYEYVTVGGAGDTASPSGLRLGEEIKLAIPSDDGSMTELSTVEYDGDTVYQMTKKFSEDDIKKGTDGIKYMLAWDLTLLVDTEDIADHDLSNYMLEIKVLPYSTADIPDSDTGATLVDYFIYTVGRIKTDM